LGDKREMEKVKKILIPTDGSDCSLRAAAFGISLAKILGADIFAIYAVNIIILEELKRSSEEKDVEKELKEKGERYLNYVVKLAEKEGLKAEAILAKGEPYDQIVHNAKTKRVDLIVMGTYGRRGTKRILIGSVTARVIEYAPCPVLVVK
jgi:nucleotide-binding universal stress UspA family protein